MDATSVLYCFEEIYENQLDVFKGGLRFPTSRLDEVKNTKQLHILQAAAMIGTYISLPGLNSSFQNHVNSYFFNSNNLQVFALK